MDLDYNPFSEPIETTFEYCSVCSAEHSMLDGGDIYDCMIYYRFNVESAERKKEREDKIETWNIKTKKWVKRVSV